MSTPQRFEKLQDRLPDQIIKTQDKHKTALELKREITRHKQIYKQFLRRAPLVAIWHLAILSSPFLLLLFSSATLVTVITAILILLIIGYATAVENNWEYSSETSLEYFAWITFAGFHYLYHRYDDIETDTRGKRKAPHPKELEDDRLPFLTSLFENIREWDRDIHLMNRLIEQAKLELIPLSDIKPLIQELKDDEQYLLRQIEYARILMQEGELGTSLEIQGTSEQLVDQIDDRLVKMRENRKELRRLSGQIAARTEVSALG